MNLCVRAKCFRQNVIGSVYRFSTTPDVTEQNEHVLIDDSDDAQVRNAWIEKKRNVSGLSEHHQNVVNGRMPYETPQCLAHLTVKYHRKLYGKYGGASGVNPSLCWPTRADIQEKLEYESVAYPFTIKEMMQTAAQRRKEEQQRVEDRDRDVAMKMLKLAQWKKELNDKINRKTAEAQAAKDRKERLVEEVRRHFGFTLDPRDERFQEMMAKREKEIKKLEKQAKKEAKEKMMIAKLQQKNVALGEAKK